MSLRSLLASLVGWGQPGGMAALGQGHVSWHWQGFALTGISRYVEGFHDLTRGRWPCARRCIANIKDECAVDYAGCWRGDFTVNGKSKTFHACKDNIAAYKVSRPPLLLLRWQTLLRTFPYIAPQGVQQVACPEPVRCA